MHDEEFPLSAIDQERRPPTNAVAPDIPEPDRVVAGLLSRSTETSEIEPISAEEVARQSPPLPTTALPANATSFAPKGSPQNLPHDIPPRSPFPSALASPPQPSVPNDLTRSLTQEINTTIRVQRELRIEIEDDVEQLAQRTSEYLATQLDQRDAQLMERIAQQINQHPTRQTTLSGPGTSVGS